MPVAKNSFSVDDIYAESKRRLLSLDAIDREEGRDDKLVLSTVKWLLANLEKSENDFAELRLILKEGGSLSIHTLAPDERFFSPDQRQDINMYRNRKPKEIDDIFYKDIRLLTAEDISVLQQHMFIGHREGWLSRTLIVQIVTVGVILDKLELPLPIPPEGKTRLILEMRTTEADLVKRFADLVTDPDRRHLQHRVRDFIDQNAPNPSTKHFH